MSTTDRATTTRLVDVDLDLVSQLDVCNSDAGDHFETVEIGPFPGRTQACPSIYYRLRSTDLVKVVDQLRRVANEIEEAVLDARADAYEARLRPCPYCSTLIDPRVDDTCGSRSCFLQADAEARVEAYT